MTHDSKKKPKKKRIIADIRFALLLSTLLGGGTFLVNWGGLIYFEALDVQIGASLRPIPMEKAIWLIPLLSLGCFIIGVIAIFVKPKDKYGKDNWENFH